MDGDSTASIQLIISTQLEWVLLPYCSVMKDSLVTQKKCALSHIRSSSKAKMLVHFQVQLHVLASCGKLLGLAPNNVIGSASFMTLSDRQRSHTGRQSAMLKIVCDNQNRKTCFSSVAGLCHHTYDHYGL
jgi:hypothetical protein